MIVTDLARQKIIERNSESLPYFRISIRGGGCSGLSYEFSYTASREDSDVEIEAGEVTIISDKKSLLYLNDAELHWTTSLMYSGFIWNNPNEKSSCSCGKSFSV